MQAFQAFETKISAVLPQTEQQAPLPQADQQAALLQARDGAGRGREVLEDWRRILVALRAPTAASHS